MSVSVLELAFRLPGDILSPDKECFRPPHWPPPHDWCVSVDAQGNCLSYWESRNWDYSYLAGRKFILRFRNVKRGKSHVKLCSDNEMTLKYLAGWLIWWPEGARSWDTLKNDFGTLRRIAYICEEEKILFRDLERFPLIIKKVAASFSDQRVTSGVLLLLDKLRLAKSDLGFAVLEQSGLAIFAREAGLLPTGKGTEQTAYIPPRIWIYQNLRLRECLNEFLLHECDVRDCYNFCVDAYAFNYGSLENAMSPEQGRTASPPFSKDGYREGKYFGPFEDVAHQFGILDLLNKWVMPPENESLDVRQLGAYLSLIQSAAAMYIANFTLQRKEEVASLRADCFGWESDPIVGKVVTIRGETTKTVSDSDARWPTSPSVEVAILAAKAVAQMRIRCAMAVPAMQCTAEDAHNPYLWLYATDPWSGGEAPRYPYALRRKLLTVKEILTRSPNLFDIEKMRITNDDLLKACLFTPNLKSNSDFSVGKIWPLAFHQYRRTSAINMFASGLLSESSIQMIMKHQTLRQSAYYGRNFSKLRFNEEFQKITNTARYEVMAAQIGNLVDSRFVSPGGSDGKAEIAVNLVAVRDFKSLVKASERGEVSFRETRLGGCTKRGHCEYGGIESISRCAGGDGGKPCREAIFDKTRRQTVLHALQQAEASLREVQAASPRAKALSKEIQGMRNFLDVISN